MKELKRLIKSIINKDLRTEKKKQGDLDSIEKRFRKEFFDPITEIDPHDVVVVGYPKSGNTWMQSLMAGMLYGIDTVLLTDKLAQEIIPDVHARKYYKRFGALNMFKSHYLPRPDYKRVIYLVRDGRDALVSYYHFHQKLGRAVTIDKMLDEGEWLFPSYWHEHVEAWLENPYDADIIFVKYEDLKTKPLEVLRRISEFLGIKRDDTFMQKLINGTDIDKMRARVINSGGMANQNWVGKKGGDFFRKGIVGDYKNTLNEKQIMHFNKLSKNALIHFDYQVEDDTY